MSLTKGEHVIRAYAALRISGLTIAASPEEVVTGLSELEDMMNEFRSRNICSSYAFEDEEDVDPNTDSNIASEFNNATQKCLAIRLAPYFGKEASPLLQKQANQALSNWSARSGKVNMIAPPNRQPMGSGNTFRRLNFDRYYRTSETAPISCSTFTIKVDEINSFSGGPLDFTDYLNDLETIVSYTTEVDRGIELISTTQDEANFTLECKGITPGYSIITLTITTSEGRVNPERINFNVTQ